MKSELERRKNHVEPDDINLIVQVHYNVQNLRNEVYHTGGIYILLLKVDIVMQDYLRKLVG